MSALLDRVCRRYVIARLARHLQLSSSTSLSDALGQIVYSVFLSQGVVGLDPNPRVSGPQDVRELTPSEKARAMAYGAKARRLLVGKIGDRDVADEAIQTFLVRLVERGLPLKPLTPLKRAEAYVNSALINAALDLVRKHQRDRKREDLDARQRTDPGTQTDDWLQGYVPEAQRAALHKNLERIHPRAPRYVEMMMEGYQLSEVARRWGLSQPYVTKWIRCYSPAIETAVRRHIGASRLRVGQVVPEAPRGRTQRVPPLALWGRRCHRPRWQLRVLRKQIPKRGSHAPPSSR